MDSLSDWYRYVDQVSRPARRHGEDAAEAPGWRPWKPTADAPEVEEAVQPDAIPDLAAVLGNKGPIEALHVATPEYRDPTIHDELAPIPTFSVPELRVPSFELRAPRLGRNGVPEPAPEESAEAPDATAATAREEATSERANTATETDVERADPEPDPSEDGGEPANGKVDALRYWDLLSQIRSHDIAQNSYKSTFRETREELVQRLLDPPLTLEETARLLGVCPTTVRRYTNKGHLRHFRTSGNQRRFRLSDVLEFLESRASEIEADAQAERDAELKS